MRGGKRKKKKEKEGEKRRKQNVEREKKKKEKQRRLCTVELPKFVTEVFCFCFKHKILWEQKYWKVVHTLPIKSSKSRKHDVNYTVVAHASLVHNIRL